MDLNEFIRLHHIRSPNIMWFLGAGASAAAGVPTAWDMIWDFKRGLYCASQRIPISACEDLGDPVLRERLQRHFDGLGKFPALGGDDEYAIYFERMYPDEADRRRYIERRISEATPSFGHHALAALLALDRVHVIWTTNFDRVVEDAAAHVLGSTGRVVVADLNRAALAREALNEGRWPLLVKLHGDFQSRRLKNTVDELREQDEELRQALIHACGRFGLALVGYSGRDDSVIRALEASLETDGAFPTGLFWFHRSGGPPLPRVRELIQRAAAAGVTAHLIEIETFDELLGDVMVLVEDIPATVRQRLDPRTRRLTEAPIPPAGNSYPVIRLNSLPITSSAAVCRLVKCGIGGAREVSDALERAETDIIVGRRHSGVLAFGPDDEVRRVFSPHAIEAFDVQDFQAHKLRYSDSVETGMILEALTRSLSRQRPVRAEVRRSRNSRYILVADTELAEDPLLAPLKRAAGGIGGKIPKSDLRWAEALQLRLDHRLGRLWLLLLPNIWIDRTEVDAEIEIASEFRRERMTVRRNMESNSVLDAWVHLVLGGAASAELSAFGLSEGNGVDACFTLGTMTAFSRRSGPPEHPARAVAAALRTNSAAPGGTRG
jgi:NAD-dependent SIR2 family protein deacetylase